jgi:hypothetical protein
MFIKQFVFWAKAVQHRFDLNHLAKSDSKKSLMENPPGCSFVERMW